MCRRCSVFQFKVVARAASASNGPIDHQQLACASAKLRKLRTTAIPPAIAAMCLHLDCHLSPKSKTKRNKGSDRSEFSSAARSISHALNVIQTDRKSVV